MKYIFKIIACAASLSVSAPLVQSANTFPGNGNVGIGTASPIVPLQVAPAVTNQSVKIGVTKNTANANLEVLGSLMAVGVDGNWITDSGAVAWNFYNAGADPTWSGVILRYYGSSYAGTGYGVPFANMGSLVFQNVSTGVVTTNNAVPIFIAPNSAFSTAFLPNGYVGIGTKNPAMPLDIIGPGARITDAGGECRSV